MLRMLNFISLRSIKAKLVWGMAFIALLIFGTSLWNTWVSWIVAEDAGRLKQQVMMETKPASDILQLVQEVAVSVAYYTRTQDEKDRALTRELFAQLVKAGEKLKNVNEANGDAAASEGKFTTLITLILAWRDAFEDMTRDMEISNRSVRGLGSQASLLIATFTQQANDDNQEDGVSRAAVRNIIQSSILRISELQNAVLFTYAAQNPMYAEKAMPTYELLRGDFDAARGALPPGATKDLYDELYDSIRDFGDEFRDLPKSYRRRVEKLNTTDRISQEIQQTISPLLVSGMDTTVVTADETMRVTKALVVRLGLLAVVLPGIAMILGVLISRGIIRSLSGVSSRLGAGAQKTSSLAERVSTASHTLADGANAQASSLEQTSASLEELSSMTKRNAESSDTARATALKTLDAALNCTTEMKHMDEVMSEIKSSSAEISAINETINEIAFQTNILALNAAVEAARAGQAGAGFAVVAEEVRALAQRSTKASAETSAKVQVAVNRSQQGVAAAVKVGACLNQIFGNAEELNKLVNGIATASAEQSRGLIQVTTALAEIDRVTQANASEADRTAAAAREFDAETTTLGEIIEGLHTLIGQNNDAKQTT